MSEFKFLCPVCGQHIATDSTASGTQIECPTCFQKIIVPQPPKSDSKYILSATQYIKPAGPPPPPALPGQKMDSSRRLGPVIFGLLALVCLAAVGIHFLPTKSPPAETATLPTHSSSSHRAPGIWRLNLAKTEIPDAPATGKVHDLDFLCERAMLQNGSLLLRQDDPSEVTVVVHLFAEDLRELAGKSFDIGTNDPVVIPQIAMRWNEGSLLVMQKFTNGYAMKLEFKPLEAGKVPGRILLCLPDNEESFVAGTFYAEIKKPSSSPKHP